MAGGNLSGVRTKWTFNGSDAFLFLHRLSNMTSQYDGVFYVRWEGNRTRTDSQWLKEMIDILYENNLKPVVDRINNLGDLSAACTTEWPSNHPDGRYLSGDVVGGKLNFKITKPDDMHDKVELATVGARQRRLGDITEEGSYAIILASPEPVDDWADAGGKHAKVTMKAKFQLIGDRKSLEWST